KATMEFEAADAGRIASLIVPEGSSDVAVGTVIALLSAEGEPVREAVVQTTAPVMVETVAAVSEQPRALPPEAVPAPVQSAAPSPHASDRSTPRARLSPADRVKVSPLALRIAEAKGIELGGITGSGPNGRIVRADLGLRSLIVPSPVAASMTASAAPPVTFAPPPEGVPVETIKLSGMRKTIARRLTESKQNVPHFYLTARCNLDAMLKLRAELNAGLSSRGIKLSVNDFMIKALAQALIEVPDANVQFGGDELHRFARADISMAVAIDGGLITPVIKDVAVLSLSAISAQSKLLAAKARDGKLMPEEYQGGTASISNLGMFGIDEMFPVINPPQALILGVAAGVEQPWKVNGEIALATVVAATASFDHRAIDGAIAAQFMASLRGLIETPLHLVS
ncbi:MAG: branched-chain alpha-keto acid dehydrogenase subunit, partial [Novosphingobium sp.]|nr:branched-chain alpha-keto acid dehydrogenase subunit [Novosphingobium sp.]